MYTCRARLEQAVERLGRVMSVVEAEATRPPPHTLDRALKARALEPQPLHAMAGQITAGSLGSMTPHLASPLPPSLAAGAAGAPNSTMRGTGAAPGGEWVVGILARNLLN